MSLIQALFTSDLYKEHHIILSVYKTKTNQPNKKERKKEARK